MGEVIENVRTFVTPKTGGSTYTFKTLMSYDSWNRIKNITYPDGEVVTYHYDNSGKLESKDGVKGSSTFDYVEDIQCGKIF